MGCDETREKLSEYLDQCLTDHQCDLISEHIENCQACSEELEHLSLVIKAVSQLPEAQAPPDFLLTLQQKINDANVPWWRSAVNFIDQGLEVMPLRAMTATAVIVLIFAVFIVHQKGGQPKLGTTSVISHFTDDTLPMVLSSATDPVPVEFASTRPGKASQPIYLDTPTEFLMAVIGNDPAFKGHQILPHPRGVGALIHTPKHLLEVVIDPAEFPIIQAYIEQQGGKVPRTLREAKVLYPIYVRVLPSPTAPISPEK